MGIKHHNIPIHLNYFSCLEDDLLNLSRWIEFSQENESTHSIELARLLMTAAAEVDVVAKALCKAIDKERNANSINVYQDVLMKAAPMLPLAVVEMPRFGMEFQPWISWREAANPPEWWKGNNKVKHHRGEHFRQANLKNVLNSVAALLLLLLLLQSKEGPYFPQLPKLFVPNMFGVVEGLSLRIIIPDGTNFPWG